jgi:hypothetical protein
VSRQLTRRGVLGLAAATAGGVAAAIYVPIAVGGGFERLVADRLGIDEELATTLLESARERYGDTEYDARAALFALAYRGPSSLVAPASLRRSAAEGLLAPLLATPAANLAYAVPGRDPAQDACQGLIRNR